MIDNLLVLESLSPAIFSTPMIHLDSFVVKHQRAYEVDGPFFRDNPERSLYLRPAFDDEFNASIDVRDFLQIPEPQALVIKLTEGVHLCLLVFYGRKLTTVPANTDADCAQVLAMMQRQIGGYANPEWINFVAGVAKQVEPSGKRIH